MGVMCLVTGLIYLGDFFFCLSQRRKFLDDRGYWTFILLLFTFDSNVLLKGWNIHVSKSLNNSYWTVGWKCKKLQLQQKIQFSRICISTCSAFTGCHFEAGSQLCLILIVHVFSVVQFAHSSCHTNERLSATPEKIDCSKMCSGLHHLDCCFVWQKFLYSVQRCGRENWKLSICNMSNMLHKAFQVVPGHSCLNWLYMGNRLRRWSFF